MLEKSFPPAVACAVEIGVAGLTFRKGTLSSPTTAASASSLPPDSKSTICFLLEDFGRGCWKLVELSMRLGYNGVIERCSQIPSDCRTCDGMAPNSVLLT